MTGTAQLPEGSSSVTEPTRSAEPVARWCWLRTKRCGGVDVRRAASSTLCTNSLHPGAGRARPPRPVDRGQRVRPRGFRRRDALPRVQADRVPLRVGPGTDHRQRRDLRPADQRPLARPASTPATPRARRRRRLRARGPSERAPARAWPREAMRRRPAPAESDSTAPRLPGHGGRVNGRQQRRRHLGDERQEWVAQFSGWNRDSDS